MMDNKMNRILLALSLMLLVACSESLTIHLDPEVSVLFNHDSKQNIRLTAKDKEYVSLNEWLRLNSDGWHPTSGKYPGGVYLRSGSHGIQITENHVIIYSTNSHESQAILIQKLGKNELRDILNIGK